MDRCISLKVNWSVDAAPPAASERACRTFTPPAGAAHVSFKFDPPPRSPVVAPALPAPFGSDGSPPLHMRAGATTAIGRREDGRATAAEARRKGKDRPLHPRRHARSGDLRQSKELSHALICPCGACLGVRALIEMKPGVERALGASLSPFNHRR